MAKLILLRHEESVWNKKNVFTGWVDVPLSSNGIFEAIRAGEQLANIEFDTIYTSVQERAIETAMLVLAQNKSDKTPVIVHDTREMTEWTVMFNETMKGNTISVYRDWHLNERYFGELQGKNKAETAKTYGNEQVHQWRRGYDMPPPKSESLKDTAERSIPFFKETILPQLQEGKNVLVSLHGNSLRSILMFIDNLLPEEVINLEIPTGQPLFYEYENNKIGKAITNKY